jgi:hypothetical protein
LFKFSIQKWANLWTCIEEEDFLKLIDGICLNLAVPSVPLGTDFPEF